jgi:hypothetical protein
VSAPFCKGCGAKMEWHPHANGRTVAIEPTPHPDGTLYFGPGMKPGMKLTAGRKGDCERTARHFHCFRCGSTDHFASDCDEEDS